MLDLHPSLKKVERAEQKLGQIVLSAQTWVGTNPYTTAIKVHEGVCYAIATRVSEIPEEIAWEVVEAVGHLRSALDKMVVALVNHNGRGVSGVAFPFGGMDNGQPEPFPSKRTKDALEKKLTPEQFALIVAQKPYPGGDDLLWAINEIANADKHRLDLVSASPKANLRNISMNNGIITGRGISFGESDADTIPRDEKTETVLLSYGHSPRPPQIEASLAVSVVFSNVPPVQGKELTATLDAQIRLVKGILQSVQLAFG